MDSPDFYPRLKPHSREDIKSLIEKGRDDFSHDEMEALLVLYEQASFDDACRELGMEQSELVALLEPILGTIPVEESTSHDEEKRNKNGQVRRKRLGDAVLRRIINERPELEAEEVQILAATADHRNQLLAAKSIGITYKEFLARYRAIRQKYDL